jgi:hypothetical protein
MASFPYTPYYRPEFRNGIIAAELRLTRWLTVKINCTLKSDLNQVPRSCFVKKTRASDQADYVEIHYNLQIENNQSGLMTFSLEIGGKEYSAVNATY